MRHADREQLMTKFLPFEFSMRDVRRSGEVIAGDLSWTPESQKRIREAFNIANIWRDSHEYPMRSIRMALGAHIRHRSLNGFTVARLKRMQAIRRKLKRMNDGDKPLGLNQLQDLGGCRAIMNTMRDVSSLTEAIRERFRHDYRGENHYISDPKTMAIGRITSNTRTLERVRHKFLMDVELRFKFVQFYNTLGQQLSKQLACSAARI